MLYPYLHIVTWGLPKRYLSLLRIFNLPLEDYPHQFITQTSETFNNYEHQVTKKSISALQPNISRDDFAQLGTAEGYKTQNVQLDQGISGNSTPPRKRGRRSKKKPVISIRVKLDDDLSNLKRTNGKNFDKILSRCSRRSCLLVIQKSLNSKHDEYSLNFVNNTSYSKPYSKLLKKNRRKREIWIDGSTSQTYGASKKSIASEFSEEAIFPSPKNHQNIFTETFYNAKITRNKPFDINSPEHQFQSDTKTRDYSKDIVNNKVEMKPETKLNETHEGKNVNTVKEKDKKLAQLAIPSHLIPYEEPVCEEKPLRNWPVLTKLFDEAHTGLCNYLKSLNSQNEPEDQVEIQEVIETEDGFVSIDINEAKAYHESLRANPNIKEYNSTKFELPKIHENKNTIQIVKSEILKSPTFTESSTKQNDFDKINGNDTLHTTYLIEKSIGSTNSSLLNEKSLNASQKSFTSTAYLILEGTNNDLKNEGKSNTCNSDMKNVANSSKSDLMVNTRLLSSSIKSYESITNNNEEETCYHFEENSETTEINKNDNERKQRGMKKLYFFHIVLALFVTVVLGIILFISFADNSTINGVIERYIKK